MKVSRSQSVHFLNCLLQHLDGTGLRHISFDFTTMLTVTDVPVEIFLDDLLPQLPLHDLLRLQCTNKFFAALCADGTFWKRKLSEDFNFPDEGAARTSGWKFIYLRLTKPRVFVWGQTANNRLGMTTFPRSTLNNVSYPLELKFPGTRIVNLVAGGMSFQALDSEGHIHVWGTLDGTSHALRRDGFSEAGKPATTPLKLELPAPIRSISCGRLHSSSLDSNNQIWTFLNWGRPFRLVSNVLTSPGFIPIQVECGWSFSAALTKSGDVVVWWPFSDPLRTAIGMKMIEMDNQGESDALSTDAGVIQCVPWDLEKDPVILPPYLRFDNALIALTNRGHVLLFDSLGEASRGNWQYLPNYSEATKVANLPAFSTGQLKVPSDFRITHISARFRTFIAYSNSVVLVGDGATGPDSEPIIIPGLQNKSVISVVLGDYHYAAVTVTGKLLTWGQYSDGALGLGDPGYLTPGTPGGFVNEEQRVHALEMNNGTPPNVDTPTEVRFDHHRKKPKDRFCISAAAAGWHTGALVIDLEASDDDSDLEIEAEERTPYQRLRDRVARRERGQGETPPIVPAGFPHDPGMPFIGRGGGMFRIGFAGRGRGAITGDLVARF
ncbi:hypothetical protein BDP27DRAFT_1391614 [Rhodocollybia butyracea]|uniref:Uncharacterized protein n=1 Tax=Rhodocollybia butyracea TaxID=206335 RepID=A0A9P5PYF0_9AGAR|nr:hypothetical protein BDP27DRAFT_1391614 [Rhodocollybia butyracea]